MYTIYLKEDEMLEAKHFPVIALVNEAFNESPLEFVTNIKNKTGSGYNYTSCAFWSELDDYEKAQTPPYDGIMVNTEDDEEIVISIKTLQHYLIIALDRLPDSIESDKESLRNEIGKLSLDEN